MRIDAHRPPRTFHLEDRDSAYTELQRLALDLFARSEPERGRLTTTPVGYMVTGVLTGFFGLIIGAVIGT
jgi:hypothetical protein